VGLTSALKAGMRRRIWPLFLRATGVKLSDLGISSEPVEGAGNHDGEGTPRQFFVRWNVTRRGRDGRRVREVVRADHG
jgi:hypothetical protein